MSSELIDNEGGNSVAKQDQGIKFLWFTANDLYLLSLFIPVIGPALAIPVAIVKRRRYSVYSALMWSSIIFLIIQCGLLVSIIPSITKSIEQGKIREHKRNVHVFQIVLERYLRESHKYPVNPQVLVDEGYLDPGLIINPFSNEPMRFLRYDPDDHYLSIGYAPIIFEDIAVGYYLLGFGTEKTPGYDIDEDGIPDHVVIAIGYGCDRIYMDLGDYHDKLNAAHKAGVVFSYNEALDHIEWMWR